MNITKSIVNINNWQAGRSGNAITGIVLHTEVGTQAGSQARFNDPISQVSVHYGIGLDGSILQWVEETNTAFQAGNWQVNLNTIGIEHEDNGNFNDAVRTDAEYNSSSDLVADICKRYNIPCDTAHIFRHHDVIDTTAYPGGTSCPDGLDTNKIISMAKAKLGEEMLTDAQIDQIIAIAHHGVFGTNATDVDFNNLRPLLKNNAGSGLVEMLTQYDQNPSAAYKNTNALNKQVVETYINTHLS